MIPGSDITSAGSQWPAESTQRGRSNPPTGIASRGRGGRGKRGRGRRVGQPVVSRSQCSSETQHETWTEQNVSSTVSSLLHEQDFCFSSIDLASGGALETDSLSANQSAASTTVSALHGLLTPHAAAAAFAAGTSLCAVWERAEAEASRKGVVHADYRETPEGSFLSSTPEPTCMWSEKIRKEQLRVDLHTIRRDLTPFSLPVLFSKSDESKTVRQQRVRSGVCIVPPLGSAAPCWAAARSVAEGDCCGGPVDDAAAMQGSHSAGICPEVDALLNVGGNVLAIAVSQECGVAEALAHCRQRRAENSSWRDTENSEGFVVLAVSVGPFHRSCSTATASSSAATGGYASASTYGSGSHGDSGGKASNENPPTCPGLGGDPFLRQQQRKGAGQLQLWTIPNNRSRKPCLRVVLQHDVGLHSRCHRGLPL